MCVRVVTNAEFNTVHQQHNQVVGRRTPHLDRRRAFATIVWARVPPACIMTSDAKEAADEAARLEEQYEVARTLQGKEEH